MNALVWCLTELLLDKDDAPKGYVVVGHAKGYGGAARMTGAGLTGIALSRRRDQWPEEDGA